MAFCWADEPDALIWPVAQEIDDVLPALALLDDVEPPLLLSSEPHAARTSAPEIATAPTVRARSPLLR
jgi:hypothetical protein